MQEILYSTTVKTHFNSFKIRSCFFNTIHVFNKTENYNLASEAATHEHFTCEQAYSGKEILHVNVLHSSRKNKVTIFSSKTVNWDRFCKKKNWRSGTFIRSGGDAKQVMCRPIDHLHNRLNFDLDKNFITA